MMKRALVFLIAGIFLQGCAAIQLPELRVRPAAQYRLFQNKEGLTISVDPFLEVERLEEFFGFNLLSKGILPILVVVENKNDSLVFYLQKEQSSLSMAGDKTEEGIVSSSRSLTYEKPSEEVNMAFFISPLIVASIWQTYENKREVMTRSMIKNELRGCTLNPGESQHGFLFFKFTKGRSVKDVSVVKLEVLNIQSKETLLFSFPID